MKDEIYRDLTIKGITKIIILNIEFSGTIKDPWGNYKAVIPFHGKINHQDWGLSWNAPLETGGL